jgi:hypothetical protein
MKIYIPFIGKVDAKKLFLGLLAFTGGASANTSCSDDQSFADQKKCLMGLESQTTVCLSTDRSQIHSVFALADPMYSPLELNINLGKLEIQQFSFDAEKGIATKMVRTLVRGVDTLREEEITESQVKGKPVLRHYEKTKDGQLRSKKTSSNSMSSYSEGLEEPGSHGIIVRTTTANDNCYGIQERRTAPGRIIRPV